ncbi:ParB/Srx family N-terminal domain-containing protein [Citrobacter amalonaticus]|nr:ParB/Srx family N-terminal domain-containing protein [Citrobacter amalonaticus]MCR9028346.1 ParB/Srx family N-terminal domain-containing protein [Citrobacter amalonaticus]
MSIRYLKRSKLIRYERNVMQHSDDQVAQIAASIREFGWTNPVLIDEVGEIIAGHGRLSAAELLDVEDIPTITLTGLTDAQKRAYRLADNKLPLNAGWDEELLKLEITTLLDSDFDVLLTGFNQIEIDNLLTVLEPDDDEADPYTTKIDTPVYEPSGVIPAISDLYSEEKTRELVDEIRAAELPEDIERFLLSAAERHTIFHFGKIADYYAGASAEIQALFERSALVIIDYQQAIDGGFVHLTKSMVDIMHGEGEENA